MARWVKLTVVYDMDDQHKSIADEMYDWHNGDVGVHDLSAVEDAHISLDEITADEAKKYGCVK